MKSGFQRFLAVGLVCGLLSSAGSGAANPRGAAAGHAITRDREEVKRRLAASVDSTVSALEATGGVPDQSPENKKNVDGLLAALKELKPEDGDNPTEVAAIKETKDMVGASEAYAAHPTVENEAAVEKETAEAVIAIGQLEIAELQRIFEESKDPRARALIGRTKHITEQLMLLCGKVAQSQALEDLVSIVNLMIELFTLTREIAGAPVQLPYDTIGHILEATVEHSRSSAAVKTRAKEQVKRALEGLKVAINAAVPKDVEAARLSVISILEDTHRSLRHRAAATAA